MRAANQQDSGHQVAMIVDFYVVGSVGAIMRETRLLRPFTGTGAVFFPVGPPPGVHVNLPHPYVISVAMLMTEVILMRSYGFLTPINAKFIIGLCQSLLKQYEIYSSVILWVCRLIYCLGSGLAIV